MRHADIKTIGIPAGLLSYRYGTLWKTFFEKLGFEVVSGSPTNRTVLDAGEAASVDEACLASKVYMGHVAGLADAADAVFVPSFESIDVRRGFCTKFQSLPDLVRNTFRNAGIDVVSIDIKDVTDRRKTRSAYLDLAERLGASPRHARKAYRQAVAAQAKRDACASERASETLSLMRRYREIAASDPSGSEEVPLLILMVAHPYIAHDRFISGDIIDALEEAGCVIVFADEFDRDRSLSLSFEFSETLPWIINRELAGASLALEDTVDGIVAVSAFPCGPDSMFNDALMRRIHGAPILNLIIDAQAGSAGMQTRIESFVDIIRFKGEGAYLDA